MPHVSAVLLSNYCLPLVLAGSDDAVVGVHSIGLPLVDWHDFFPPPLPQHGLTTHAQ
jgi:hypothetical protein